MKKNKFILLVAIGFLVITQLNAYQEECMLCPPPSCECPKPPPCCENPVGPTTSAYNHPANIDVCGSWNTFVTGTFLWILPSMEQLEFAEKKYPANTIEIGKVYEFDFDWVPAFKVGLGFNFEYDNWDLYFQYIRIKTSMKNTHILGNSLDERLVNKYTTTQLLNENLSKIKGKWDLNFNVFDLEFARPYYNGKHLLFRAHYGLKGGWINQSFNIESIQIINYLDSFNSKSWLIGPRSGIQTKWTFCNNFRFFGNAAASLFYQKFYKITFREPNGLNPKLWYVASDFVAKQINASLESLLGIGWGSYFYRNKFFFDISVGYETQLFLNQNKINFLELIISTVHAKAGNLMFHGLNISAEFNF